MKRLQDLVCIITGGSNGIGKAACLKFAQEGAIVVNWDINEAAGLALQKEVEALGSEYLFLKVDTSKYNQVVEAAKETYERFGRIDVLINNAGITRDASLRKMQPEMWQAVIDVNLTGVFNCGQAVSGYMLEQGSGRIINTSSVVGLYGNFGQTNYAAAKAGVIGITQTWAKELGRKGITCNAVAPGFIATEMTAKIPANILETVASKIPLGTLGQPEDIANAYCFLASPEGRYINGAVISVDGGVTL